MPCLAAAAAGFVLETGPVVPIWRFSGAPLYALVMRDLYWGFLEVRLLDHNGPVFVSRPCEAPFRVLFEQCRDRSISDTLVVGTPYGDATYASAHERVLAATPRVAREKMKMVSSGPPAFADLDYSQDLDWLAPVSDDFVRKSVPGGGAPPGSTVGIEAEDGTLDGGLPTALCRASRPHRGAVRAFPACGG